MRDTNYSKQRRYMCSVGDDAVTIHNLRTGWQLPLTAEIIKNANGGILSESFMKLPQYIITETVILLRDLK